MADAAGKGMRGRRGRRRRIPPEPNGPGRNEPRHVSRKREPVSGQRHAQRRKAYAANLKDREALLKPNHRRGTGMKLDRAHLLVAISWLVLGTLFGFWMGARGASQFIPVHTAMLLPGFVTLAIMG